MLTPLCYKFLPVKAYFQYFNGEEKEGEGVVWMNTLLMSSAHVNFISKSKASSSQLSVCVSTQLFTTDYVCTKMLVFLCALRVTSPWQ